MFHSILRRFLSAFLKIYYQISMCDFVFFPNVTAENHPPTKRKLTSFEKTHIVRRSLTMSDAKSTQRHCLLKAWVVNLLHLKQVCAYVLWSSMLGNVYFFSIWHLFHCLLCLDILYILWCSTWSKLKNTDFCFVTSVNWCDIYGIFEKCFFKNNTIDQMLPHSCSCFCPDYFTI